MRPRSRLVSSLVIATVILVAAGASNAAANQPPVATPQSVTTAEDTAVGVVLTGTDPDGDPLTFAVVSVPASGTLTGSGAYRIYTPNAGFSGSDSFTFTADDGTATSNPETVSITVTAGPAGQPFAKTYTRSGGEAAHSIARTQDGGYVYAGETTTPGMGKDVWVVKVDGAGKVVWQYAYGGAGDEGTARAYGVSPELNRVRVIATSDGGYAVAATTNGSFGPGGTSHDAWVLKLDALGGVMWQFAYGGYSSEAAADIVEIPGAGYAVAGSALSFNGNGYDAWILRLDPYGFLMWQTTYGLWGDDYAMSLAATPSGGLAVTGLTYSFGTDPWLWVMMLDPGLNVVWDRAYAASGFGAGNSIVQTSDGGLAVTGTIGGEPGVLKLDFSGNVMWQTTFGLGTGYEGEGRSIVQTADGGYAVAGVCCTGNEGDAWVLRLDASGALVWQKSFGDRGIDRASALLETPDGGYAVAGETWSFGPTAALLLKLDANGNVPSCVPLATPSSAPPITVATTDFPYSPSVGWVYGGVFATSASPASTTATTRRECPNSTPVADAGANRSVFVGDTVPLDGSASSDADGDPLTYAWSLTSRPAGSAAALSSSTTVNPTFVPDVAGTYVVDLVVSDPLSTSPPDSVTITAVLPSLQLAPSVVNLLTFESTTLTVTSAKAGVQAVSLASSDVAVASVPASTTTPPGAFTVTAGSAAGTATITVSATSFTPATSQVTVALRNMTLSTAGPLVGINKTLAGTVTLAQAAPSGVTISLASSAPGIATVTAAAPIAQGSTSGSFTITGVAVGNVTITASAPGFAPTTVSVTVTSSQISLGQGLVVAPGQAAGLALSIGQPAPAGGVTITLTSGNPAAATVTSSVFIAAGQQIPAANPTVTGVSFGSAQITASAAGYAPDTSQVQVTVTLGLNPTSLTVIQGATGDITLNVSAPAPASGFTFNVAVANTSVATAPAAVAVTQGTTSEKITVTGVSVGTTTLQVSAPGVATVTATIKVDPKPAINVADAAVGKDLQVALSGFLGAPAPANNLQVTVTSADPTRLLLSTSPTTAGSASVTLPVNAGNTWISTFYVQGLGGTGSVQITTSAAGYTTDTSTISLFPSGFIINSPSSIATNNRAPNTSIQIMAALLTPTLAWNGYQPLRAGMTASVPVTSSNASVGTITVSPVVFNANDSGVTTEFDPQNAGTTTISIGTPAGFSTPTGYQQIPVTVTAPAIHVSGTTIGKNLQTSLSGYLDAAAPAGNLQVTITSADAARLLLSTSATTVGSGSITLQVNAGDSGIPSFYLQALDGTGTVQITTSAPGYATGTSIVTLQPSGFIINSPGNFSTTTFAANATIQIAPARLDPNTLAWQAGQPLRAGATASVPVTSSSTAVGTITVSPVVFNGNDGSANTEFDPLAGGTATIEVAMPAGFSTPSNYQQITATVTAPAITASPVAVGLDLQTTFNVFLPVAPPSPVTVTVTSASGLVATLTTNATVAGGTTLSFANVSSTYAGTIYVQGRSLASTTLTVQAPGYTDGTATVTVDPSGFVINNPGSFSTTTFSANAPVQISSARLEPGTLNWQVNQPLRGGASVSVAVTSSNPAVGPITTSPLTFNGGDGYATTEFDPQGAGTSTISVGTPAGFSTPNIYGSILATVTSPAITASPVAVGLDLQTTFNVFLPVAPPSPVTVTVTSASGAVATLTTNATVAGGTTLSFANVSSTYVGTIYVQGRSLASTTLTVQAPGYTDGTATVTVDPSGFLINSPGSFSTTTFSGNAPVQISSARLEPGTLNWQVNQPLRGGASVSVAVTSSNPAVGPITTSPLTFNGGDGYANTEFDPQGAGTTTISVGTPAGFSTSSSYQQITATVSAPAITVNSVIVGRDLQALVNIFLPVAPPSPVTITVTSNDAAKATLTTTRAIAGGTTVTFNNVSSTFAGTVYVQGIGLGSTTLTVQATGYTDGTGQVTVDPSGFIIDYPGSFATTASAADTSIRITPARLDPMTLNWAATQELRGGASASVAVTSSDASVGTITTSPLTFNGGDAFGNTTFDPVAAGTATITVGTPASFVTPSNYQQITATVNP